MDNHIVVRQDKKGRPLAAGRLPVGRREWQAVRQLMRILANLLAGSQAAFQFGHLA